MATGSLEGCIRFVWYMALLFANFTVASGNQLVHVGGNLVLELLMKMYIGKFSK